MIHIYIMYLPISEKNDGNRTGQKHRTEHKAGTELLAVGLRELYGMELNRAGLSYGQHGKPYLRNHPEIHFNISHCEGLAVCVFSDTEKLFRRYLTEQSRNFFFGTKQRKKNIRKFFTVFGL